MKKRQSNISYRLLAWSMKSRGRRRKPKETLSKIGIKKGQTVLDYGAGPGVYSIPAAQIVGESGKIYSADIHPMAGKIVRNNMAKFNLNNIETLLVNINTGLPDETVDCILLFDVMHHITEKSRLLKEMHRVLKMGGNIFILPDHLSSNEIKNLIKGDGLFIFKRNIGEILEFQKLG